MPTNNHFNFIEQYLRLTEELESPTSYLRWGAISCISAVLRDNVFFSFPSRLETVYPNLYVLLLGETAKIRKSPPMNIASRLVKEVRNTKCMAGAASMQGVLRELSNTEQGKPKGGSGFMIAKELDAFFVKDPNTISILTDLYDFHPLYEKFLVSYDIPPIPNVCLSLIAGSNEVMMKNIFNQTATEGGLLGRFFVIAETEKRQSNSGFEEIDESKRITDDHWKPMVTFLKTLSTVKGPMTYTQEARKFHNDWYHSLDDNKHKTKTGYEHRIATHAIKLATVLSACKTGFDKTIELSEAEEAIKECGNLIKVYKKLTLGTGSSNQANVMSLIIKSLLETPSFHMSCREILYKNYGDIDAESFEKAIATLVQTDLIEEASINMIPGLRATPKLLNKMIDNKKAKGMVQ